MTISATSAHSFTGLTDTKALASLVKIKKPELIENKADIQNLCHHLGKWIIAEGNTKLSAERKAIANNFFAHVFEVRTQLSKETSIADDQLQAMNIELLDIVQKVANEVSESQINSLAQNSKDYNSHDQLRKLGIKQNDFSNLRDNVLEPLANKAQNSRDSKKPTEQKMLFVSLVEKALNNEEVKSGTTDFNKKLSELITENINLFSPNGIKEIASNLDQGEQESVTLSLLTNRHMVSIINTTINPDSLDDSQKSIKMKIDEMSKEEIYDLYKDASSEDIAKVDDFINKARNFRLSRNPEKEDENSSKIDTLENYINENLDGKQQAYLKVMCQKKQSAQTNIKILDLVKDLPLGGVAFTSVLGGMFGGLFGAPVMGVFVAFVLEIFSKLDNQAGADQTITNTNQHNNEENLVRT